MKIIPRSHLELMWKRAGESSTARARKARELGKTDTNGYFRTLGNSQKREHVTVAEKALGRPLPPGAQVHHVNEIKNDNRGCNLVICPNAAYHRLLHQRTQAYDACGHADWLKCCYCGKYDDPNNLVMYPSYMPGGSTRGRHRECQRKYNRENEAKKRLLRRSNGQASA